MGLSRVYEFIVYGLHFSGFGGKRQRFHLDARDG